jgi:mannose-1-phosphate guanylyltransferase
MIYTMIMAGGSGTRLWPLSRKAQPKQTLHLTGETSLYQQAVGRLEGLVPATNILTVANARYAPMLHAQTAHIPLENYLIEPEGRGTAAAIGLAAIHLRHQDPDAVMMVLTADHAIADNHTFRQALRAAVETARQGWLVTLGIPPSHPSTGYGYIRQGSPLPQAEGLAVYSVERFIEKPDLESAQKMLATGGHSWNSGMFIWTVERILAEFRLQMPALSAQLEEIAVSIGTSEYSTVLERVWPQIQKQTIDYGVMEHARQVAVVPAEIGWVDVGSWASLYELLPADALGNCWTGPHLEIDASGVLAYNRERLVAVIGLRDLVIVDTPDAILVCPRAREQEVKKLVEMLQTRGQDSWL